MVMRIPRISTRRILQGGILTAIAISTLGACELTPVAPSPLSPLAAYAQTGYPTATDPYINDYAELITPEDAASIRQALSDLELQHGIEATVLTLHSIQEFGTGDAAIESFATNLFNTWGIGDAEENNGILVLVAVGDRKVRIEVGSGYGTSLDSAMKTVIEEFMTPRFKQNDYSGGIRRGVEAIIRRVSQPAPTQPPAHSPAQPAPSRPPTPTISSPYEGSGGKHDGWLTFGGIGGLGAAGFGIKKYLRYRHRRCPSCDVHMARLGEHADDQFLDKGQQVEERINSVDYDVWQCPSCQHYDINRYGSIFSRYSRCKGCGYKTMGTSVQTIVAPTYSSTGTARVTETCQQCSYRNTYTKTIPRKERSSSSSSSRSSSRSSRSSGGGSSSRGGRSSGGGASGGW